MSGYYSGSQEREWPEDDLHFLRQQFMVMRMFVRLNNQADRAYMDGRTADFCELCKLLGRLEYMHFAGGSIREDAA